MTGSLSYIANSLASGVHNVASRASAAVSDTVRKVQEVGSAAIQKATALGCGAIQRTSQALQNGKKAYEAVYHPQKVVTEALHSYLRNVDLRDSYMRSTSETTHQRVELFFQKFQEKQNTALTKKIATKLRDKTLDLCSTTLNAPLTTAQEAQFNLIISKLPAVITEANMQKMAASIFNASSQIIESVAHAAEGLNNSEVKARLLGYTPAEHIEIDRALEEEKKALEIRVNTNLCTLLKSYRKKADLFTWKHLIALITYIAVRFFGYGVDLLNSIHAVANEELSRFPELTSKFESCSDFIFLKFLETITLDLLEKRPASGLEVDRKWDQLAEISGPYFSRLLSSKLAERSIFLRGAVGLASSLAGTPSSIMSRIRPSQILPTVVEDMQNALKRAKD